MVNSLLIVLGVVFISPVPVIVSEEMWHPENALSPIVMSFGIVIEVKEDNPENALSLIVVIPSLITTLFNSVLISLAFIFISPVPVIVNDEM